MTQDSIADVWTALAEGWGELLSAHPVVITLLLGGCAMWLITRR